MKLYIKPIAIALVIMTVIYLIISIIIGSFNPIKWIVRDKLAIRPTLVELARTVEIEQLIATEYFGETLTSLDEVYTALELNIEDVYQKLHQLLSDTTAQDSALISFYTATIEYKYIHDILRPKDAEEYIQKNPFGAFVANGYYSRIQQKLKLIKENNQLVYLVRGKVRATFDVRAIIDSITSQYKNDTLFVSLGEIQPEILSTINPWFVHPREGFEDGMHGYVVIKEKDVESDFEYIRQVRLYAEKKLKDLAIEQGIVERATVSLKSTLAWLLSLVFEHNRIVINIESL